MSTPSIDRALYELKKAGLPSDLLLTEAVINAVQLIRYAAAKEAANVYANYMQVGRRIPIDCEVADAVLKS